MEGAKIGGEGKIVEVDESKIGKRKSHKGRKVDGVWVFGMVERDSGDLRLEVCPDNKRDQNTLLELVKKHVSPGTTIMSDCWRGYNNLSANGYNHLTVNHTKNFVDPHTGANTQKIESNWHALKRRISRGGVQKDNYGLHFAEFLWMRKNKEDGFKNLVNALKKYKY